MTDGGAGLLGFNLFIYGANDPINNSDPTGHWIISNFIKGLFARSDALINNPNLYTVSNWLTLGAVDTVKGAVQPEKPLSLQHWADSFATATMVMPLVSKGLTVYDGLKTPAVSTKLVTPDDAIHILEKEPFVPDEYWTRKAGKIGTPLDKYDHFRLYNGQIERSTVINDFAGRQSIRIDWANHGLPNHGIPHIHFYEYSNEFAQGHEWWRLD